MTTRKEFTIGADPELFAVNRKGQLVSCIGLLGGSKVQPRMVGDYFIQEDNVMAEFNIPPAINADGFVKNVMGGMNMVQSMLSEHGLSISQYTTAKFNRTQMKDERCFVFGCDPDFGSDDVDYPLPPPDIPKYVRYAGGHVHVGYLYNSDNSYYDQDSIISGILRYLDLYVGLFCTYMDPDKKRKAMYGTPGRHRPKHYGIEYRLPSNFWIFKESTIRAMYDMVDRAVQAYFNSGPYYPSLYANDYEEIKRTIINDDKEAAVKLLTNIADFNVVDYCKAL